MTFVSKCPVTQNTGFKVFPGFETTIGSKRTSDRCSSIQSSIEDIVQIYS
jgi:hypothetical protein